MAFIELRPRLGSEKFLFDPQTGWKVTRQKYGCLFDNADTERSFYVGDSYEELRSRLTGVGDPFEGVK